MNVREGVVSYDSGFYVTMDDKYTAFGETNRQGCWVFTTPDEAYDHAIELINKKHARVFKLACKYASKATQLANLKFGLRAGRVVDGE